LFSDFIKVTCWLRRLYLSPRDLILNLDVAYLFLDAIRIGMRLKSSNKDAVLIAYAIMRDGTMELLAIDLGHSESDTTWGRFVSGLKSRGLKDPLLVCSDGNAAVIKAIDASFCSIRLN
jgi:transposase-like protein